VLVREHVDLPRTNAGDDRVGRPEIDPDDAHAQRCTIIRLGLRKLSFPQFGPCDTLRGS
jgi:hypothetical protein